MMMMCWLVVFRYRLKEGGSFALTYDRVGHTPSITLLLFCLSRDTYAVSVFNLDEDEDLQEG